MSNSAGIMEVKFHATQHIPYDDIIPFSYDNVKTYFQNWKYIRTFSKPTSKNGVVWIATIRIWRFEFESRAFKFLIVLLACYNILLHFNLSFETVEIWPIFWVKIDTIISCIEHFYTYVIYTLNSSLYIEVL